MSFDLSHIYRRIRYLLRLYLAFIFKYKTVIFYSIIILILVISLPKAFTRFIPKYRPTQDIGIIGRYNITNLPLSVQKKLSIGLTTVGIDGSPLPGLAAEWTATDSGLLYTFKLNSELYWTDDTRLTSADLQFKFNDATVLYPDQNTLQIKLNKYPFSPLPVLLSKPLFKNIPLKWPNNIPFVGIGSYRISSYKQQGDALTDLILKPTDTKSSLPNLHYHFYFNQSQSITALKLAEIEILENITDIDKLKDWKKLYFTQNPSYDKVISIVFNYKGKLFAGSSGRNYRSALNSSLDKSSFPYKAIGPIPQNSWAYSSKLKTQTYDPEKAVTLLEKLNLPTKNIVLHTFPGFIDTAEKIKADWQKIGVNVDIVSVTDIPEDFEAILMPLPLFSDPDQYHLWHSKSESQNFGHYNNPRIDKLLEDGRRELNSQKRKLIYEDFQKYLTEDIASIFLYYPVSYTVSQI